MPFTCRVFDTIDAVDAGAWDRVCAAVGNPIFVDRRFAAAVEAGMSGLCRFWYVIVDDEEGHPVACAGLTEQVIDYADFGDTRVRWIVEAMPWLFSRFRRMRTLFCSLPGAPGEKSVAMISPALAPQVLPVLDAAVSRIAAERRVDSIMYKEFGPGDLDTMAPLLRRGYRCIEIPPMHLFRPSFRNFEEYCAALKKRYRQTINYSLKKIRDGGIEQRVLTDPDEIVRAYTPEAHRMYCEVVAKSDLRVEVLPIEYYHQLARRLSGNLDFVAAFKDGRAVSCAWCVHDAGTYHLMYAGFDYRLNGEYDLYFNMMYAALDSALRSGVPRINVGQTATVFKARVGCYPEPLYIYSRGVGPLMGPLVRYGARLLVIKKPSIRPSDIFRREGRETDA